MAYKDHLPLWILLLASIKVCYPIHVTDDIFNFLLKKPTIKIIHKYRNAVNVTWNAVESEIDGYQICYNFSFRFLDKKAWKMEMLTENYRIVRCHLHPGFIASVSNALCDDSSVVVEGNKTESVYHAHPVYVSNVSCTIYNVTNLNCTWEWKKDTPPDVNYSFALRFYGKTLTCKQYLKRHGRNTGCHMKNVFSKEIDNGIQTIKILFSNNLSTFSKTFQTSAIELLNAPINISLTSIKEGKILEWLPPSSLHSLSSECFEYYIRVTETQTKKVFKNIAVITGEKQEYVLSDLDEDKHYSVQIRAKKNIYCASSKYWGEWSHMVLIGKDKEVFPLWIIIVIIASTSVIIIFLLIYLLRRYVKKLILVAIPDPSEKLKISFSSNNFDSQRCIAVNNEQPVPITEIEIVNWLTDSQECQDSNDNYD